MISYVGLGHSAMVTLSLALSLSPARRAAFAYSQEGKPCGPILRDHIDAALLTNWHEDHGTHLASLSYISPSLLMRCQPRESDFLGDTVSFSLHGL